MKDYIKDIWELFSDDWPGCLKELFKRLVIVGLVVFFVKYCVTFEDSTNLSDDLPDEIAFSGKVVNSVTGEWPNDRLVLLFLKSQEVDRAVTSLGKFTGSFSENEPTPTPLGIVDGFFILRAPNTYKLTPELLAQDNITLDFRKVRLPDGESDLRTVALYAWFDEIIEGDTYKFHIPSKNISYTIVALEGPVDELPADLLVDGSTELLDSGEIAVRLPGLDQTLDPAELRGVSVQDVKYSEQTEQIEINRMAIPLDNCGGTVDISQKYSDTQTFMHEYKSETGFSVGAEIPLSVWAKLLAQVQTKYGFTNGQIDTRTIEYNMAAAPGTSVVYYVTWKEVWDTGSGSISTSDSLVNVPFRVRTDIIYEVSSEFRSCP